MTQLPETEAQLIIVIATDKDTDNFDASMRNFDSAHAACDNSNKQSIMCIQDFALDPSSRNSSFSWRHLYTQMADVLQVSDLQRYLKQ